MRLILCCISLASMSDFCHAADWPGWLGPHGTGTADGSGYPVKWSKDSNLLWKTELPGPGGSTPAVAGNRIFVTLNARGKNRLICFRMDGRQQWSQTLGTEIPGKHKKATGANSSPLTDGQHVFAYFKSGDLGCCSLDGELIWSVNLHKKFGEVTVDTLWWDLGNSPVLIDGAIVVSCVQSGPSWIAALRATDGRVLWKVDRDLDAPLEANQSYSTPAVVRNEDNSQTIIVLGSDHVTAHAAKDGTELWRAGGLNPDGEKYFRSISSPVATQGIVLAPYARGTTLTAIRMGGSGDVTDSHVLYTNKNTSADVPTPAVLNDRAFICGDGGRNRGTVYCLDIRTGRIIWNGQLPKSRHSYSSSPVVADGHLYLTREDGTVFVVDANASEFTLVSENVLENELTVATPVFVGSKILLRSHSSLSLIGL
ncbi:MAG: PQQ-like beta-propeller repeat protein [Fuerstiella sp.]|nr:PQQ-like beta-propeller repeat protein [Fuerstiella sp.]